MEEAVVKKGFLYMYQQQTFGKKWRKFWGVLYRGSSRSSSRLELLGCKLPPSAGKTKKKETTSRRLIHLRDCVYVAETAKDNECLKETTPFLLETTEKCYLLAAESAEATAWILALCEHAFKRNSELEKDGLEGKALSSLSSLSMVENPLYSPTCKGESKTFPVTVRATPASERIQLWGRFLLSAQAEALDLCSVQGGIALHTWPYRFLRRFGHDKTIFSFEAGRRCSSGEGSFEFVTPQGKEIVRIIEGAIEVQKKSMSNDPTWEASAGVTLPPKAFNQPSSEGGNWKTRATAQDKGAPLTSQVTGTNMIRSLESIWKGKPGKDSVVSPILPTCSKKVPPRLDLFPKQDLQSGPNALEGPEKVAADESESEEPFNAASKSPGNSISSQTSLLFGRMQRPSLAPTSLGSMHVYDDPEISPPLVYDEPQEITGEAWKLRATAEDPVGHEYPYSPGLDDYAVPRLPGQGIQGIVQSACEHRILRFKAEKNTM
ncbi:docking protein 2 [Anolis carolinensis]|uniref:docking protein 2 n=1 Tax=Anolis carolinensis TaxID=28377 RepID=UPI002F2B6E24